MCPWVPDAEGSDEGVLSDDEFLSLGICSGVRWNDPVFGIQWPTGKKIISKKDKQFSEYCL